MYFFIDSLVTNISLGVVMLMVVLMFLLKLGIVTVTVISNDWWWSSNWWNTLHWNFTLKSVESIAWLLFNLGKSCWLIKPFEFGVEDTIVWIGFLDSSPWHWENGFIVSSESMYFLINSLVTNVLFLCKCWLG